MPSLSVQYPDEVRDSDGNFSRERLLSYYEACKATVENAARDANLNITEHRVLILVDLQGVYLGLVRWLAELNVPLDGGMLPSRLAHYFLGSVTDAIERKVSSKLNRAVFRDLVRAVFRKEASGLQPGEGVLDTCRVFPSEQGLDGCRYRALQGGEDTPDLKRSDPQNVYTLRHSVITDLVAAGLPLLTVAQISGTSAEMIEKHYGHLVRQAAVEALATLTL